jgi:hypothetical protein
LSRRNRDHPTASRSPDASMNPPPAQAFWRTGIRAVFALTITPCIPRDEKLTAIAELRRYCYGTAMAYLPRGWLPSNTHSSYSALPGAHRACVARTSHGHRDAHGRYEPCTSHVRAMYEPCTGSPRAVRAWKGGSDKPEFEAAEAESALLESIAILRITDVSLGRQVPDRYETGTRQGHCRHAVRR